MPQGGKQITKLSSTSSVSRSKEANSEDSKGFFRADSLPKTASIEPKDVTEKEIVIEVENSQEFLNL